jgi:hypothetical protein
MAADQVPTPAADTPPGAAEQGTAAQQLGEGEQRCGAVLLTRYLKHDGRALLLYRHDGEHPG